MSLQTLERSPQLPIGERGREVTKPPIKPLAPPLDPPLTPPLDPPLADAFNSLTQAECERFRAELGREPNALEWDLVSAMWSEHCSYKSSRALLRELPSTGERVIGGAGENAGALRIGKDERGDDYALVFKMESHNHPSMIAPREGAATGVGGIMRDIFTMGARPIANLNALRFGNMRDNRTRELVRGVVEGIGFYGNCTGIPTVGGECEFDADYDDNILVNAMTVGVARADGLFSSCARGVGNWVVYLGARTGRDGIDGARMASRSFTERSSLSSAKPQVQVGDPFAEKRLFEACLEAMERGLFLAVQDMGAAGLLSSSCEMAAKGEVGMRLDLAKVPLRNKGISAGEIMLSESQERMLAVVDEQSFAELQAIFTRHRLECCVIGELTLGENLELYHGDMQQKSTLQASISASLLSTRAPILSRERKTRERNSSSSSSTLELRQSELPDTFVALDKLLSSPRLFSKSWITEQYDSIIGGHTLRGCGGEAALLRIAATNEILAITSDCTPRYCRNDARLGALQAVAEAWRNLSSTGAQPLAITDNLNFGNPEDPYVMDDFAETIAGIAEACRFFELPVVSGNVSFYNETAGKSIPPTPVIGAIGIIEAGDSETGIMNSGLGELPLARTTREFGREPIKHEPCENDFVKSNLAERELFLLGGEESPNHSISHSLSHSLGASLYMQEILGEREGTPPHIDLAREKLHGDFVRLAINEGLCYYAHDLSCGGLLVKCALLIMNANAKARAELELGIDFVTPAPNASSSDDSFKLSAANYWFGEEQARYLLCLNAEQSATLSSRAAESSIPFRLIGRLSERPRLTLASGASISVAELREGWSKTLADYMNNKKED